MVCLKFVFIAEGQNCLKKKMDAEERYPVEMSLLLKGALE